MTIRRHFCGPEAGVLDGGFLAPCWASRPFSLMGLYVSWRNGVLLISALATAREAGVWGLSVSGVGVR